MEQATTNTTPKRPQFLTVLCILTFIGSSIGLFYGFTGIATADTKGKLMENVSKDMNQLSDSLTALNQPGSGTASAMLNSMTTGINADSIRNAGIAGVIANLLTLFGAIMMWKLRKMGFWLYVLGVIIAVVAPIVIYKGNMITALGAVGIGFFGILFIVLYGINRKHLVN